MPVNPLPCPDDVAERAARAMAHGESQAAAETSVKPVVGAWSTPRMAPGGRFGRHPCRTTEETLELITLAVDSAFFSTIVLVKNQLFRLGF